MSKTNVKSSCDGNSENVVATETRKYKCSGSVKFLPVKQTFLEEDSKKQNLRYDFQDSRYSHRSCIRTKSCRPSVKDLPGLEALHQRIQSRVSQNVQFDVNGIGERFIASGGTCLPKSAPGCQGRKLKTPQFWTATVENDPAGRHLKSPDDKKDFSRFIQNKISPSLSPKGEVTPTNQGRRYSKTVGICHKRSFANKPSSAPSLPLTRDTMTKKEAVMSMQVQQLYRTCVGRRLVVSSGVTLCTGRGLNVCRGVTSVQDSRGSSVRGAYWSKVKQAILYGYPTLVVNPVTIAGNPLEAGSDPGHQQNKADISMVKEATQQRMVLRKWSTLKRTEARHEAKSTEGEVGFEPPHAATSLIDDPILVKVSKRNRNIGKFACEPESNPHAVCFEVPGTNLKHEHVKLQLETLLKDLPKVKVVSIQFDPRSVANNQKDMMNRWIITTNSVIGRDSLAGSSLNFGGQEVELRPYDEVISTEYQQFLRIINFVKMMDHRKILSK